MESSIGAKQNSKMMNISSTFFVLIILALPIIIYATSLSTIVQSDASWFTSTGHTKMPDLMYSKFGLLIGVIVNGMLGASLVFVAKLLIRSFSTSGTEKFVPNSILNGRYPDDKPFLEKLMFWLLPIMILLYALAYPVSCQYKHHLIGGVLLIIPGVYFVLFGLWLMKYSWIITLLMVIYGIVLIYESVFFFLSKDTVENGVSLTSSAYTLFSQ